MGTTAKATTLLVATMLAGAFAAPVHAVTSRLGYTALGDSFSAGLGTRAYLSDGTDCKRSRYAFPALLSVQIRQPLDFQACAGSTIDDVANKQLSKLSTRTAVVSVSVGGNDAGFADVTRQCALPSWASDCMGAIDKAQNLINTVLPAKWASLYRKLKVKAPNAVIVVVGYPRLFNGKDCNLATFFSAKEMQRLNETADLLNDRMSTQAGKLGLRFANPTVAFSGHAICDDPEWVNGLSLPFNESYHPNRSGQVGYRDVAAGSAPLPVGPAPVSKLAISTGPESGSRSEVVPGLDLHSPSVLAVAQRIGVNVDDPVSVAAADRAYEHPTAAMVAKRGVLPQLNQSRGKPVSGQSVSALR